MPIAALREPMTILVVDDDAAVRAHLAMLIDAFGHRVVEAHDARWALELWERHRPDLVLSDIEMPGESGLWLAQQIRDRETGLWTPIIFLSLLSSAEQLAEGIEAGADDYLVKPVHPRVLEAKLRALRRLRAMQQQLVSVSGELQRANAQLQHEAECDALTGLLNRRTFDRLGQDDSGFADLPVETGLILMDIDRFKLINDTYGHIAGDQVLRATAGLVVEMVRKNDLVMRYGGEEFAIVLPSTSLRTLARIAETLRVAIAEQAIALDEGTEVLVTASFGVATGRRDGHGWKTLIEAADQALYMAKAEGRNRVGVAGEHGLAGQVVADRVRAA